MNKKIGSVYEDIIKPLEENIYKYIREDETFWRGEQDAEKPHLRNVLYGSEELLAYALLRKHVPKIAEFIASFIVEHDAVCSVDGIRWTVGEELCFGAMFRGRDGDYSLDCTSSAVCQKIREPRSWKRVEEDWQAYLRGEATAQDILNLLKEQGQENKLLKSAPSIKVLTEDTIRARLHVVSESAGKTPHFSLSEELEDLNSAVSTPELPPPDIETLLYKVREDAKNTYVSGALRSPNPPLFLLSDDDNIIDPSKLKSAENILKEWSEAHDYKGEDTQDGPIYSGKIRWKKDSPSDEIELHKPIDKNEWKDRLPSCEIKLHKPAPTSEINRDPETDLLLVNLSQRGGFFLHSGEKTMVVFVVNTGEENFYWCEISGEVRVPIPFGVLYATIKFIREKGSIHEHPPTVEVLDDWVKAVHRDLVDNPYIDLNKIKWDPKGEGTFSTDTMDFKFVYFMASKCYGVTGW